jgi:mono/diheme cytochrome c family protein
MSVWRRMNAGGAVVVSSVSVLVCAGALGSALVFAQTTPPAPTAPPQGEGATATAPNSARKPVTMPAQPQPLDPYDRVSQVWYFQRLASSGSQRGQEIYYMRCWICHNEYTVIAEPGAAPSLRDLYKKPKLMNGQPVNDQTVAEFIRKGTGRMPAYSPEYFKEEDLKDLVVYLREKCGTFKTGGGCFDEHNPPVNPMYKAK